ncbi:single-stranded DNA-binding protein [Coraliomargarita akajimensis]|uniref:Single-stranded DNA-binding protein n=1 Tax=Coraliomargarita akajimensis (strain DSM 45221 / IAM 15411 / JCM 23193 / KCTC 12865 / 04OKA010-24) TaxID=583355 RepID=D5EJK6_CORAD|nr:single-stranded DNA-binding protein [Coraliomargarita akajimensis]ADE54605.1 single-strand binding protein [Coraliomargarita akajimensis DSM 45221]
MASFNKVILIGNLTRDPEMRVTPNGNTICKLGLAVSRAYSTRDGERREETTFVDVDAFGKQAEVISKYMRKGRPIMIEGRLRLDQWETSDGQKRSKLSVVLENFQFLGGRDDSASSSGGGYEQSSPPQRSAPAQSGGSSDFSGSNDMLDEDVPF